MVEELKYVCEKCGASYTSEDKARRCEEKHIEPKVLTNYSFWSRQEYPNVLTVEMEDGTQLMFVRKSNETN